MAKSKLPTVSVDDETIELIRTVAKNKKTIPAKVIKQLCQDFLELDGETHAALKAAAAKRDKSVSSFITELVQKSGIAEEDKKCIILQIPKSVAESRDSLDSWLKARISPLLNLITSK